MSCDPGCPEKFADPETQAAWDALPESSKDWYRRMWDETDQQLLNDMTHLCRILGVPQKFFITDLPKETK